MSLLILEVDVIHVPAQIKRGDEGEANCSSEGNGEGQLCAPFKEHKTTEGQEWAPPLSHQEPRGTFQHMAQFRQQMETGWALPL